MDWTRCGFLGAAAGGLAGAGAVPVLSFGVLADVQYAGQDTANSREYRRSLDKLRRAAVTVAGTDLVPH
jgi:hypothetical protein